MSDRANDRGGVGEPKVDAADARAPSARRSDDAMSGCSVDNAVVA